MEFFGREIKKTFKGVGVFVGKVTDYHKSTGYRVQYDDGDSEDLTHKELVRRPPRLPLDSSWNACLRVNRPLPLAAQMAHG